LIPPATGTYIFYLQSSNASELDLNTNDNSQTTNWTLSYTNGTSSVTGTPNWGSSKQASGSPGVLQANQAYYFIAYHKFGEAANNNGRADDFSVGWSGPGFSGTQIIDGQYLAPFPTSNCAAPTVTPTPSKTNTPTNTALPTITFTPSL